MVIEEYKIIRKNLIEKVNKDITDVLSNDNEYYYAVGQCAKFMVKRSTYDYKQHKLITKPLMLSKDNTTLKQRLRVLYNKFNTNLFMEDKNFNNCLAMVTGYIPNGSNINKDCLELGYLENSIL